MGAQLQNTSICVWGITAASRSSTKINGEYLYSGILNNYPYYTMAVDATCFESGELLLYYDIDWNHGQWCIVEAFDSSVVREYCDLQNSDDPLTGTGSCENKWQDANMTVTYGSCPEWDCDAITTSWPNTHNCGATFDIHVAPNVYKASSNDVYLYYNHHLGEFICDDVHTTGCAPGPLFAVSFDPWKELFKGSSIDVLFSEIGVNIYNLYCIGYTTSSAPTNYPTTMLPTTKIPTTPTPTTVVPTAAAPPTNEEEVSEEVSTTISSLTSYSHPIHVQSLTFVIILICVLLILISCAMTVFAFIRIQKQKQNIGLALPVAINIDLNSKGDAEAVYPGAVICNDDDVEIMFETVEGVRSDDIDNIIDNIELQNVMPANDKDLVITMGAMLSAARIQSDQLEAELIAVEERKKEAMKDEDFELDEIFVEKSESNELNDNHYQTNKTTDGGSTTTRDANDANDATDDVQDSC